MPSPFPGMDPYLEDPELFPSLHQRLAVEIADRLNPQLGTKYFADVNVRTVLEEVTIALPKTTYRDVSIYKQEDLELTGGMMVAIAPAPIERVASVPIETKLFNVEVRVTETGELVTSIEILSPYNKRRGEGLDEYRQKRKRLLLSNVHLVEIDLLRGGQRPGGEVSEPPLDAEYILLVNRSRNHTARISEIWPVELNQPLPILPIPLLPPDPDIALDLNTALRDIYTRARYEARINYQAPVPSPPLRPAMRDWVEQSLLPQ
jgi:hypothetical protein